MAVPGTNVPSTFVSSTTGPSFHIYKYLHKTAVKASALLSTDVPNTGTPIALFPGLAVL